MEGGGEIGSWSVAPSLTAVPFVCVAQEDYQEEEEEEEEEDWEEDWEGRKGRK